MTTIGIREQRTELIGLFLRECPLVCSRSEHCCECLAVLLDNSSDEGVVELHDKRQTATILNQTSLLDVVLS